MEAGEHAHDGEWSPLGSKDDEEVGRHVEQARGDHPPEPLANRWPSIAAGQAERKDDRDDAGRDERPQARRFARLCHRDIEEPEADPSGERQEEWPSIGRLPGTRRCHEEHRDQRRCDGECVTRGQLLARHHSGNDREGAPRGRDEGGEQRHLALGEGAVEQPESDDPEAPGDRSSHQVTGAYLGRGDEGHTHHEREDADDLRPARHRPRGSTTGREPSGEIGEPIGRSSPEGEE